jgi:hypothetical protein
VTGEATRQNSPISRAEGGQAALQRVDRITVRHVSEGMESITSMCMPLGDGNPFLNFERTKAAAAMRDGKKTHGFSGWNGLFRSGPPLKVDWPLRRPCECPAPARFSVEWFP